MNSLLGDRRRTAPVSSYHQRSGDRADAIPASSFLFFLKCCMKFSKVKIPGEVLLLDQQRLSQTSHCVRKEICVDPEASWVSRHVAKVDKRTTSATAKTQSPTV
uniref:Chemokine ligand 38-like protein n=1 Tax=Ctenopharyngodon idella TaxID=7959 RepID=A0A345D763_CTEID|nr:chemokine ligand 38-like protein [Ctenopharyngodon idella]